MAKKKRINIPPRIAARILFLADHTCCRCWVPDKPVQIHHIDEDPSNNTIENLAVLCLEHHNETQISGGFGRKLDADSVMLYRNDWNVRVAERRAAQGSLSTSDIEGETDGRTKLELATSLAEIYRENRQYKLLITHYNTIGNDELRDKYIDLFLQEDQSDSTIFFYRKLQGKPELIPQEVIERRLARFNEREDWSGRARLQLDIGNYSEAAAEYVRGIGEALQGDYIFNAAFKLKELVEKGLIEALFVLAFEKAADKDDLHWQIRALEELGWHKEIQDLVLRNAKRIEESGHPDFLIRLAEARGDTQKVVELKKSRARQWRVMKTDPDDPDSEWVSLVSIPEEAEEDTEA